MALKTVKTDIFLCEQCGNRQRLAVARRHWCDLCTHGSPVEMHLSRSKLYRRPISDPPQSSASNLARG